VRFKFVNIYNLHMNPIKSFRNELNLTQQKLALFLDISRDVLARAETKFPLPTAARVRLSQVGRLMDGVALVPPDECAATKKALLKYAKECSEEAKKKRLKLEELQAEYTKAVRLYSLSNFLLANVQELQLKAVEIKITKLWRKDALLSIDRCGLPLQQLLERQAVDLEAAAAKATAQAAALGC
jgi:transcriptional regulator with XRE-family HTH domain